MSQTPNISMPSMPIEQRTPFCGTMPLYEPPLEKFGYMPAYTFTYMHTYVYTYIANNLQ